MIITYYGIFCFKIQSGETVLAINPFSKKEGLKNPRFRADVVFVSHNHEDHNSAENGDDVFLINGPGEYEVSGVYAKGIQTFRNTIYKISLENVNLCHLGDFGEKELRAEVREDLGEVDVLFVPINGEGVASVGNMVKIINQIEPKVIIPMNYTTSTLANFLKEIGQRKIVPVDKFTFRKKDIADKKGEVVVTN